MFDAPPESPQFGLGYALAAYVVIFAALFGYLALLHWSARRMALRLGALEERLGREKVR
jgi:hypothetical protein